VPAVGGFQMRRTDHFTKQEVPIQDGGKPSGWIPAAGVTVARYPPVGFSHPPCGIRLAPQYLCLVPFWEPTNG